MEIKKVKTLRSLETQARYERHLVSSSFPRCYLCTAEPIKAYKYWKIIENQFPYDEIATTSHMVAPKSHKQEGRLTKAEREEFKKVRAYLHKNYDVLLENTHKRKSMPGHHHLHLLQIKERLMITPEHFHKELSRDVCPA